MNTCFIEQLRTQLLALPNWSIRQERLYNIIVSNVANSTGESDLFLAHLEQTAMVYIGAATYGKTAVQVEWTATTIDWAALLAMFEQLLTVLLPFLSGL